VAQSRLAVKGMATEGRAGQMEGRQDEQTIRGMERLQPPGNQRTVELSNGEEG
ncbi:hypothetical protein P7K49_004653, partial [Saguinus oedipus]